jgi:transcriptional regulator with PAS, ATPase and Fis domain
MALNAASSDAPIVLLGETGVGKECFAKMIHDNSRRAGKAFVAVNCGAIPRELIGSEIFGYAPGAFTGAVPRGNAGKIEAANGGTLFLDELNSLPLEVQGYLLRALEENELFRLGSNNPVAIDVRIVCATNVDLMELVRRNEFRSDLYFRLNVVEIKIPPLRERFEDMNDLISHFSTNYFGENRTLSEEELEYLQRYPWPGNVRELKNAIWRALALRVDIAQTLSSYVARNLLQEDMTAMPPESKTAGLDSAEKTMRVIEAYDGNISRAAKHLGIARSTVYRRLRRCAED